MDAELDAANRGGREHQALIACELRDVMIDDGREILRNRDFRELRPGCSVVTGLRGTRDHLRHHRRDEQRQAVGALVQRAHERFVGGDRWRSFRHVVGDLAFGERIEHDLLAQVMQAQLVP